MAEDENASLDSHEVIAKKLPKFVKALEQIYEPNVNGNRVELGFLYVMEGGTSIITRELRYFLDDLEGRRAPTTVRMLNTSLCSKNLSVSTAPSPSPCT